MPFSVLYKNHKNVKHFKGKELQSRDFCFMLSRSVGICVVQCSGLIVWLEIIVSCPDKANKSIKSWSPLLGPVIPVRALTTDLSAVGGLCLWAIKSSFSRWLTERKWKSNQISRDSFVSCCTKHVGSRALFGPESKLTPHSDIWLGGCALQKEQKKSDADETSLKKRRMATRR